MSRTRKTELAGPIAELRARAKALEESTVTESVLIDAKTYERLVDFVEREGCSFCEGLRRALKIGVEALMLEHREAPNAGCSEPEDCPSTRSSSAFIYGREVDHEPSKEYTMASIFPGEDEVRVDSIYAVTAPPGL